MKTVPGTGLNALPLGEDSPAMLKSDAARGGTMAETMATPEAALAAERDRIAAAVWAHQNATMPTSWTDFCSGNYTCWPHREADAILAALPSYSLVPTPPEGRVDMFATRLQETGNAKVFPGDETAVVAALRAIGAESFTVSLVPTGEVAGEPTKRITATDLTDALTRYFIDQNMGMPGPRQERMAADVWFRLTDRATLTEDETDR